MVLWRLQRQRLVVSDERYPPAFARTLWGDIALRPDLKLRDASGAPR